MKKLVLTLLASVAASALWAQDDDWNRKIKESQENARKEYEMFRQQALKDYEDFRKKANEEYAKFMEEAWVYFPTQPAEEIPWKPKPVQPVVFNSDDEPKPSPVSPKPSEEPAVEPPVAPRPEAKPIDFELKPAEAKPLQNPQPVEPIVFTPRPGDVVNSLYFFGTELRFHFDKSRDLKLAKVSEKSVAALWRQLSDPYFDNLVAECLQQRKDKELCDWAYIMLTEMVAEKCCGGHTNEAVVLHMYLLTQSGYQMRMGRADGRLCVLVGSDEKIYHYKYFMIDGVKYYNFDISLEDKPFCIFNHAFPNEKTMSLRMRQPKLAVELTEPRTIVSKRFPDVKATIELNKNLIDFYNSYPLSANWPYYSETSLSETLKECLYPVLRKAIEGKSQSEAANILINFVQTGFAYATDQEQFGYERPLFPDETFYYPFCDCEDRAILYSCLVRELLGLDAVLLDYPEHLATAVCFTDKVAGDYLTIEGKRYVICDPTYIGAEIGRCMPKLITVTPKVEKL